MSDLHQSYSPADCKWSMDYGIFEGFPDGSFGPKQPVLREQLATILRRVLTLNAYERRLCAHTMPHSVTICARYPDGTGAIGSGTIVGRGRILTDAHVVHKPNAEMTEFQPASLIELSFNPPLVGSFVEAAIVKADQDVDLALLECVMGADVEWPVIEIATAPPEQGQRVYVVGSPLGRSADWTSGSIRSLERVERAWKSAIDVWAVDAPINPGNSGGTVVDGSGRFIGVPVAKDVAVQIDDYCYVVPLGTVRRFLTS